MKVTKIYKMRHRQTGLYLGHDSLTKDGRVFKIRPDQFGRNHVTVRIPTFHVKKFPVLEDFRIKDSYLFEIPQKDWVLEIYEPMLVEEVSYE